MKKALNDIDETSKVVGRFLRQFQAKSTYHGYKSAIKTFFEFINEDPDKYITDVRLMENGDKIHQLDIYEQDIKAFWSYLIKQDKSPKTVKYYIGATRVFFKNNKIKLDDDVWSDMNRRGNGSRARTREKQITTEIIEQMLPHAKIQSKAMILMLSSSGMRIGELLQLTKDDINFESNPTKIYISAEITKNNVERITFISDEATRHLKEWLKVRNDYLKTACKRTKIKAYHGLVTKSEDDDTIFPFSDDTARRHWNTILRKTQLNDTDKKTKFHKYRIHGLRKFFRQNFVKSSSSKAYDAVEQIMGHTGYLRGEYATLSEEELRSEYMKGVDHVLVLDRPMLKKEAQEEIERQRNKIEAMKTQMKHQQDQMNKLMELMQQKQDLQKAADYVDGE